MTPSLRSQKGKMKYPILFYQHLPHQYLETCHSTGAIWTKMATNFDWWEVELIFRVTGRGRIGADGLVFSCSIFHPLWTILSIDLAGRPFGILRAKVLRALCLAQMIIGMAWASSLILLTMTTSTTIPLLWP